MNALTHSLDATMIAAARRCVRSARKMRVREFIRRRSDLDVIYPGLSRANARGTIAIAEHLIERERSTLHRWVGFGGENDLINAHAVMLLGRALRLAERRAS